MHLKLSITPLPMTLPQFRDTLTDKQRLVIRQIAEMRFAADMVPDAFLSHLSERRQGALQPGQASCRR